MRNPNYANMMMCIDDSMCDYFEPVGPALAPRIHDFGARVAAILLLEIGPHLLSRLHERKYKYGSRARSRIHYRWAGTPLYLFLGV